MYPDGVISGLLFLTGIWLLAITWIVWQDHVLLKKLFPKGKGNFRENLEEVLTELKSLQQLKVESSFYLQKIALKRYNPYRDTGGDQSFSVSLLNGQGDGVVLTSLHCRAGTRVFAKPVKQGKEDNFQFSQEESQVVKESLEGNLKKCLV